MRLSHARRAMSVRFDDPNLVSCGGLAAVLALAARCGLATLLTERLRIAAKGGANATAKVLGAGRGHGLRRRLDQRHGPAAPRRHAPAVHRHPSPVDLGHVPAAVHLRACPPTRRRGRRAARPARGGDPDPGRRRPGRLPGSGRHRPRDLRVRQAGHRPRLHRGERAQRAAGHDLHADLGAGDRRHPAAQGRHELGARRRQAAHRRPRDRAAGRRDRAGDRAGGLGLLQLRHHQHLPPRRGPVLGHRPPHPHRDQGDHHHRRTGVGADPLPERHLGRRRAALGLRRRGRRNRVHRVHQPPQEPSTSPPR